MDEVDGMSAGDRGGIGALNALIKKSRVSLHLVEFAGCLTILQVPIICIANDRGAQKLKPLTATTYNMPFRRYVHTQCSSYSD
jgi:replication factor C subunit 1